MMLEEIRSLFKSKIDGAQLRHNKSTVWDLIITKQEILRKSHMLTTSSRKVILIIFWDASHSFFNYGYEDFLPVIISSRVGNYRFSNYVCMAGGVVVRLNQTKESLSITC